MKFFAETEKAVKLAIVIDYVDAEFSKTYQVWVPKSQLQDGVPSDWITRQKVRDVAEVRGAEFAGWRGADDAVCGSNPAFKNIFSMLSK